MGVHRITSEAAKYYAMRERILGSGISLLGAASEKVQELDKDTLEKLGDVAAFLLPHSPGYAGKFTAVIARLFWALAGVEEKEFKFIELDDLEKMIEELKEKIS
ncbi:hypothetical protein [Geoglobus acetivorans]|uniref:Uncharacterized protein n=1 Tax=Geoglobus acetivorans TaxID=565033 RepID=A0ABZ3H0I3_GEOAI|nr:hypothetical protein [Geoglobus acetivorans]